MYEMLAGRPPFIAKTADTLARLHREKMPQLPSELNPKITPGLEQIIMKVLAKEPAARYRTADQLGRVLMTFGQQRPSAPSAPVIAEPAPTPAPVAPTVAVRPPTPQPLPPYRETYRETYRKQVEPEPQVDEELQTEIDWISVGLGLLALVAVGGLIPLWIAIILRWSNLP
jgi:serine/threonine-protein kinase